jgi:membrane fusion protein, heavy metal efflux system
VRLLSDAVRLVSLAPEVDPAKGTVTALLEVDAPSLILGSTVDTEVMLAGEREGIVVPTSAVVDDGGVTIVYLQLSGERFARQEVEVLSRQGDRTLVEGLEPGQRLVTLGGEAIRRAGLMSSGAAEGHVH